MSNLRYTNILITGGTGSFGQAFVRYLLEMPQGPERIAVYSRDELKQSEMARALGASAQARLRFFLGDVRDRERLTEAMRGIDWVVHAAAQKQVPAAEYNPTEAVATNVRGAENLVRAAIEAGVKRVLMLSTDKAVNPANLYGATKLTAERIVIAGNALAGALHTRLAVLRYGNVVGSRGSVVPYFRTLAEDPDAAVPITAEAMTRFWVTLPQAIGFVLLALERMIGGEVFVPKLRSARILDLAEAILPGRARRNVGIRPGEKVHETLISREEAWRTLEFAEHYLILPDFDWRASDRQLSLGVMAYRGKDNEGCPVDAESFGYSSECGPHLTVAELRTLLQAAP